MSYEKSGYNQYKKTSIQSATREELLLMMYEGAMKFLKRAILACEKNDVAGRCENIMRTYDIVLELNNTLDHEVGGDIAKNLEQLYMFISEQLTKSNASGETEPLKAALNVLETLYEGWVEAIKSIKKNDGAQSAS